MTGPARQQLRCRHCGAELTLHSYKDQHWYTDEDGVMVCPAASTVVLEATLRPELERRGASAQWHGGPLAALIDSAGDYAVALNVGGAVPTINATA